MKKVIIVLASVILYCNMIFAGQFVQNNDGFYYVKDEGKFATSEWVEHDLDGDGFLEYYYFNEKNLLITNSTTPDGYIVNEKGQWVKDGQVQKKAALSGMAVINPSINIQNNNLVNSNRFYQNLGYGIILDSPKIVHNGEYGDVELLGVKVEFSEYQDRYKVTWNAQGSNVRKLHRGVPDIQYKLVGYGADGFMTNEYYGIIKTSTLKESNFAYYPKETVKLVLEEWN